MATSANRRRVLIFSFAYYPRFVGGAEIAIKQITDLISPDDIAFDLISLRLDARLPKYEKMGNVDVYRVGWAGSGQFPTDSLPWYLHLNKYAYLVTGLFKAFKLNRKHRYDIIWSVMATYSSFAAVLFKLIHPETPYLLSLQDGDPITYIKRRALPLYPLFKMIFTRADHVQAISKYLADWARDMGSSCPVTVVPNAVDYELFSKPISGPLASELRARLGKKDGDVFLVTTSRLVLKNAVGDVIEALKHLPDNYKFLILGRGYEEARLRARTRDLKIQDRVKFLGYVPQDEIPRYLQISDVFVRPSLSEGLGNSFLEAMGSGIPVIATAVGGIPDFLTDGQTGLFCEVNDPLDIAHKVEKIMADKESRDRMVGQAKDMVRDKYQWKNIAGQMQSIFSEMDCVRSQAGCGAGFSGLHFRLW